VIDSFILARRRLPQRVAAQDAELVALGVGQDDERIGLGLPDIHVPRSEGGQPCHLCLDVAVNRRRSG